MENHAPYLIKYNYEFFVFSRIAMRSYLTQQEDTEHIDMFVQIIDLYEDFVKSEYNDTRKNWQECMELYIGNLIG